MPFGPSWTCCFLRLYHDSESQIGTRTEHLKPLPIIPDRGLRQLFADAESSNANIYNCKSALYNSNIDGVV